MTDEQTPTQTEPQDFEALWHDAIRALSIVGRQVRALRAEVEALRGEPK